VSNLPRCGTIALPAARSFPTRADIPRARGKMPDLTGRAVPSAQRSQKQSAHGERLGCLIALLWSNCSGPDSSPRSRADGLDASASRHPRRAHLAGRDGAATAPACTVSAMRRAPRSCGCCRCPPLRCSPSAPAFRPSAWASSRATPPLANCAGDRSGNAPGPLRDPNSPAVCVRCVGRRPRTTIAAGYAARRRRKLEVRPPRRRSLRKMAAGRADRCRLSFSPGGRPC
jgi:hypothetical protein